MMGKFEKGQYVRALVDWEKAEKGGIYAVSVAEERGVWIDVPGSCEHWMINREIEPWVPKVGDRVTANKTARVNIERHWNEHFRRSEGDIINGALIVASVSDRSSGSNIGLSNKDGRGFFFMPESTLRPADPAPATLTIEAGNDNAKFKIGDVVRDTQSDEGSTGIVREAGFDRFTIEWIEDGVPSGTIGQWPYDDFVIAQAAPTTPVIVALIEDGKVKPATRPKVHPDQATATTEAERLALAHPGQQFGVFVLADSKIADVITETVQRTVLRAA